MSKPKVHTVYPSTADGLSDILGAATADEPAPTASAAELVEEAHHAGPLSPLPATETLPTVAGGGGGDVDLVGAGEAPPDYRQAAENLIELAFAAVPAGDWQPENNSEREELIRALERVFAYRGIAPNLPPEVTLLAVMGKYTRRRMGKPAVRSKLAPLLARVPLLGKLMGAPGPDDPAEGDVHRGTAFQTLPRMSPPQGAS